MSFLLSRHARALLLLFLVAASPALGQDSTSADGRPADATSPPLPKGLTGKERTGAKWMDEQRADDCKVPIEKRGSRPRPAACSNSNGE